MAALKTEPLIEPLRIDAGLMGQQFDQLATLAAGLADRPLHELLADAAAATVRGDAHVLDQRARGALRAQARQDAKLQAADDRPLLLRDHERDVRIAREPLEGVEIRRRQRILDALARAAERIVGQHADDRPDIVATGTADRES